MTAREREAVKRAFYRVFQGSGEHWFTDSSDESEDAPREAVDPYWDDFCAALTVEMQKEDTA